jgi:hypothetical protein
MTRHNSILGTKDIEILITFLEDSFVFGKATVGKESVFVITSVVYDLLDLVHLYPPLVLDLFATWSHC